tara:strand:- start:96 stop:476 length:381 start_codon:yes stop_codon:yes gene_type:complete
MNSEMDLQIIQKQIQKIEEDLQSFIMQKIEASNILDSINEIKKDARVFSPIGGGVYVDSKVNSTKFMINLGSKTFTERSKTEVIGLLKNRIKEIEKLENKKTKELEKLAKQGQQIHEKLIQNVRKN